MEKAKRVLVLGSSFAGLTAALELRRRVPEPHEIVVVSRTEEFLFMPSLIWLAFGLRKRDEITFPVRPALEQKGITFKHAIAAELELHARRVRTSDATEDYDYLVIATGPTLDFAAVPGLGPAHGYTESIFTLQHAERTAERLERLYAEPGPAVIGAVQGASSFGAAYEFALNLGQKLEKRGLLGQVPLTFVTPEPYVGHFGMGGFGGSRALLERRFAKLGVTAVTSASVREVTPSAVHLDDGRRLPFSFAMLAPAFRGAEVTRTAPEIVDARGFVKVNDAYQTFSHHEVFAAGIAVAMQPAEQTPVPCAVPKTGYMSEEMARVVAHNVHAMMRDEPLVFLSPAAIGQRFILDAGGSGVLMTSDHTLEPRDHAWLIPGPEAHWAKIAFEKYFLASRRRGHV